MDPICTGTDTGCGKNAGFGYAPELEYAFKKFEDALDKFSNSIERESWYQATFLMPPAPGTWNDKQQNHFRSAMVQAPAALAVAPYTTIGYLVQSRDMAAKHGVPSRDFWRPLRSACELLTTRKLQQQEKDLADK